MYELHNLTFYGTDSIVLYKIKKCNLKKDICMKRDESEGIVSGVGILAKWKDNKTVAMIFTAFKNLSNML